jgi:hypothetical protein
VNTLDRLRQIVRGNGGGTRVPVVRELTYEPVDHDGLPVERPGTPVLDGAASIQTPFGPVAVIDRQFDAGWHLGAVRVEECDVVSPEALSALTGRPVSPRVTPRAGPVFLDLETTGLSGGAGTVAFLVGCGYFEHGAFRTRQFFLDGYAAERALLHAVAEFLGDAPFIVTYNGRTFDVPVMEMRWQFHRIEAPIGELPHVDMLPPARRLWREADDGGERSCRLVALEEALLGYVRTGDVPGWEIPQRYFHFVRHGDASPLEPVLLHNRLDLVSLAAITARAQRLFELGPEIARDAAECVALGRLYRRCRRGAQARDCFRQAAARWDAVHSVREDALYELATLLRRERRFNEAAAVWRELLALGHGRSRAGRDAIHALAVHHEHREKDLRTARVLAMRALQAERDPGQRDAVRHRLARLDRKLAGLGVGPPTLLEEQG